MAKHLTPIKAIRAKCIDCSCSQISEIRDCQITSCSLHPYRMGKRPTKSDSETKNHKPTSDLSAG